MSSGSDPRRPKVRSAASMRPCIGSPNGNKQAHRRYTSPVEDLAGCSISRAKMEDHEHHHLERDQRGGDYYEFFPAFKCRRNHQSDRAENFEWNEYEPQPMRNPREGWNRIFGVRKFPECADRCVYSQQALQNSHDDIHHFFSFE